MTDAEIEAYGKNLDEAFENAGRAVESLMVDLDSIRAIEARELELQAKDLGSLLYQWVESLISLQDSDGLLFSKLKCKIVKNPNGSYNLLGRLTGEKFNPERHEQKTAIKAPTFHEMRFSENKNLVTLRFLVDL